MSSHADVFACFDEAWPGLTDTGFEDVVGWVPLGRVPSGAGVERTFWDAVSVQQVGGPPSRWRSHVDFHVDVPQSSPAHTRLSADGAVDAARFWLGLHPFAGTDRLFVSSSRVERVQPAHRFQRHPGMPVPKDSTLLGFRLSLTDDGTYFDVARP